MAVQTRRVSLTFQTADGEVQALSNVDLDVAQGDFVSFIGASGCGKTTLLRIIADLERSTSGTYRPMASLRNKRACSGTTAIFSRPTRSIHGEQSSATSPCRWGSWATTRRYAANPTSII